MADLLDESRSPIGSDSMSRHRTHRAEFLESAPAVILAQQRPAPAQIRLNECGDRAERADPVRVFQEFATSI